MNEIIKVEIPVDAEAAQALSDPACRDHIGRLVSRLALLYRGPDPLAEVLERTSSKARAAGLTDAEIDAELDAYNAEHRS